MFAQNRHSSPRQGDFTARSRRVIDELAAAAHSEDHPAFAACVRVAIAACNVKLQRLSDGQWYVEMCGSYLGKVAEVSGSTGRKAWRWIVDQLGAEIVHPRDAGERGASIRPLQRGERWGQHAILPQTSGGALQALLENGEPRVRERLSRARTETEIVTPRKQGTLTVCRCPFHDDHDPSLVLNTDGSWKCFGCPEELSVGWWRETVEEEVAVTRVERPLSADATIPKGRGVRGGSRGCLPDPRGIPQWAAERGSSLVWSVGAGRARRRPRSVPLSELLLRTPPEREADAWAASGLVDQGEFEAAEIALPDDLVSIAEVRPRKWQRAPNGGWIPEAWKPIAQRWVLFDLDDFDECPVDVDAAITVALEQDQDGDHLFDGAAIAVQTSPTGLQVWRRLREVWHPEALRARWDHFRLVGEALLGAVRASGWTGGHVDEGVWSPGRTGRLPGWRLWRGVPHFARVIGHVDLSPESR